MAIKGLIFDFDGLILDTEGPIFQSWQELYQSYGCQLTIEDWASIIGTAEGLFDPFKALEQRAGQALDWKAIEPARRQRETELIAVQPALSGVVEILQAARPAGLRVALASSSTCDWVTSHLTRLGMIGFFDFIVASDDVQRTKPDPELFRAALAGLGLQPDEAVVFEDSPNGVLAAKRAGLAVVAVPNSLTRSLPLELADLRVDSLAGISLAELLARLAGEAVQQADQGGRGPV